MTEIRTHIRTLIRETVTEVMVPTAPEGSTIDMEGLDAFLQQSNAVAHKEQILSILEGQPDQKVVNDTEEYISFHDVGKTMDQLESTEVLRYFVEWNGINVDPNEILAFVIKEVPNA